jgi:hypothetical protein
MTKGTDLNGAVSAASPAQQIAAETIPFTCFRRTVMQPIKDLPRNEQMDSDDMAAIEGGRMKIKTLPPQVVLPTSINPVGPWNDSVVGDVLDAALAQSEAAGEAY